MRQRQALVYMFAQADVLLLVSPYFVGKATFLYSTKSGV
jgi:hypothetical protein